MNRHLSRSGKTLAATAFLIAMSAIPAASQTLTVLVTGSGKVSGTGIDCGSDCSETLQQTLSTVRSGRPRTVVLTASGPGMTSGGVRWGGACLAATGPTCTVTLPAGGATVSAVFATVGAVATRYTLSVSKTGSGTVTSSPAGVDCGADCLDNYDVGTVVTLTAAAGVESTLSGWGGACLGTGTCVVSVDAAKSVSANFTLTTSALNCQQQLQQLNVRIAVGPANPGVGDPITVYLPLNGIAFTNSGSPVASVYMDCRLALALYRVAGDLVARGIDTIDHLGAYNYRCIQGTGILPDCTLYDHSYGMAIDFASFSGGGTTYSVLNDWVVDSAPGTTCAAATANARDELLHRVACWWRDAGLFTVILTPNYAAPYRNHIHVGLTTGANFIR